jgi:hypothetical protein
MSPTKLSLAGNNSRLGTGKSLTFFLQCRHHVWRIGGQYQFLVNEAREREKNVWIMGLWIQRKVSENSRRNCKQRFEMKSNSCSLYFLEKQMDENLLVLGKQ